MKAAYPNIHQPLIDACRRGDRRAQFELYRHYARAMYNVAWRLLGHTAEAEDAMQEAFAKAFDKLDTYRGEVSFGAWLKRIVVNTALDLLKQRRVQWVSLDQTADEPEPLPEVSDAELAYQVEAVRAALAKLPQGYRVVLSLVLFEGYDHDEVAQILGIGASASRSQYSRAMRKLHQLMASTPAN